MSWKAMGCGVAVVLVWMTARVGAGQANVATGNILLRICTDALTVIDQGYAATTMQQANNTGECHGFLRGLVEGYEAARYDQSAIVGRQEVGPRLCRPQVGFTVDQATRIVVKYLEEHPQSLQESMSGLALAALEAAYPCPSSSPPPQEATPTGVRQPTAPKPSKGR